MLLAIVYFIFNLVALLFLDIRLEGSATIGKALSYLFWMVITFISLVGDGVYIITHLHAS